MPNPVVGPQSRVIHSNDPVTIIDFPQYVSAAEFGATGNGVTDDSAAINAALLALSGTGLTLYVPAGTYLLTANAIVNAGNVSITTAPGAIFTGTQAALTPLLNAINGAYAARAVVTTLQAYGGTTTNTLTESSNGAISAADGVTLVVGDVVLIQTGTTNLTAAADAGPWVVANLGSAGSKWVLTRPSWWQTGQTIPQNAIIRMGPEGNAFQGSSWKSFAAIGSAVIGTNDPALFVDQFVSSVTLVTGFTKLGPSQTFPGLRANANITFTPTNFNGAASTVSYRTGSYASGGSATATGALGTSTVSITALVAAGTFNTSDVGTGLLAIRNW